MGDEGLEPDDASCLRDKDLGQLLISTDAESDATYHEETSDLRQFAASLAMIAGLPITPEEKADAVRLLLESQTLTHVKKG